MAQPEWVAEMVDNLGDMEEAIVGGAADHAVEVAVMACRWHLGRANLLKADECSRLGRVVLSLESSRRPFVPHRVAATRQRPEATA